MGSLFTLFGSILVIAIAAGGYYLYLKTRSDTPLFTPRLRRLAFIERAHLDGGRKLLLVRRDNVEHLILVGGPIDLVVETGIRPDGLANGTAAEDAFADVARSYGDEPIAWPRPDTALAPAKSGTSGPRLSLSPEAKEAAEKNGEETLELTPLQETTASR